MTTVSKEWKQWSIYFNLGSLSNWGVGIDYYQEWSNIPLALLAKVFQVNLLFFRITITRWEKQLWT